MRVNIPFPGFKPLSRFVDIPSFSKCEHPIVLKDGSLVPCGHCDMCIARFEKTWLTRMNMAFKMTGGYFLTLTFNEEHRYNTSYKVVQDFLKRYRKWFPQIKFKYFGCFEKGDNTEREHFHAVFFTKTYPSILRFKGMKCYTSKSNFEPKPENEIKNPTLNDYLSMYVWQQGYCRVEPVKDDGQASLKYVARYVTKKKKTFKLLSCISGLTKKELAMLNKYSCNDEQFNETISAIRGKPYTIGRVPFYFMSKSLGENYFLFLASQYSYETLLTRGYLILNDKAVPLPRYFYMKYAHTFIDDFGIPIYEEIPYYMREYLKLQNKTIEDVLTDFSTLEYTFLREFTEWFLKNFCNNDNLSVYIDKIKGVYIRE